MRREEWNRIKDAGKYYDAIQIPEELDEAVRRAVASVKSDQNGAEIIDLSSYRHAEFL